MFAQKKSPIILMKSTTSWRFLSQDQFKICFKTSTLQFDWLSYERGLFGEGHSAALSLKKFDCQFLRKTFCLIFLLLKSIEIKLLNTKNSSKNVQF